MTPARPSDSAVAAFGAEPERTLALLKRFGWNATSFQSLEPEFQHWFDPAGDGCVGFVDTGSAWVAAGAPITSDDRLGPMATAFAAAARAAGRRVSFFATERRFLDAVDLRAIPIGEQPVWDSAAWAGTVETAKGLRAQLRRAANKGVVVRPLPAAEILGAESVHRRDIDRLIGAWLDSRRLPPLGFLVQVYPYSFVEERRFFVAEVDGRLVGFLAMVPVYARPGWLIEDMIRGPDAPNGTAELLVDAAMRDAAGTGSRYVTLGLAPLAGAVSNWLRAARLLGRPLYNFAGLRAFKARLRPARWEPIYVAYPAGQSPLLTIYDTLRAFAREGLLRFGLKSLWLTVVRRTR